MAISSTPQSNVTVAESILRFNQISAGRYIVGVLLSVAFICFGASTLLMPQTGATVDSPVVSVTENR